MKTRKCLVCWKQYYDTTEKYTTKSFIDKRIIPVEWIEKYYDSVEFFIFQEEGTTFEADRYYHVLSNKYEKRYEEDLINENN